MQTAHSIFRQKGLAKLNNLTEWWGGGNTPVDSHAQWSPWQRVSWFPCKRGKWPWSAWQVCLLQRCEVTEDHHQVCHSKRKKKRKKGIKSTLTSTSQMAATPWTEQTKSPWLDWEQDDWLCTVSSRLARWIAVLLILPQWLASTCSNSKTAHSMMMLLMPGEKHGQRTPLQGTSSLVTHRLGEDNSFHLNDGHHHLALEEEEGLAVLRKQCGEFGTATLHFLSVVFKICYFQTGSSKHFLHCIRCIHPAWHNAGMTKVNS